MVELQRRESTIPGRVRLGLAPGRRNGAECETQGAEDARCRGLARVIMGILAGLVVFGSGYDIRHPGGLQTDCQKPHGANCPPLPGSGVPMVNWIALALLATAIIIAW